MKTATANGQAYAAAATNGRTQGTADSSGDATVPRIGIPLAAAAAAASIKILTVAFVSSLTTGSGSALKEGAQRGDVGDSGVGEVEVREAGE